MAKKTKDSGFNGRGFMIAGVLLAVIFALNIFLLGYVYNNTTTISSTVSNEMNQLNSANGMLNGITREVLELVCGAGKQEAHVATITAQFKTLDGKIEEYLAMPSHSVNAAKRLKIARAYIEAYRDKLKEYNAEMNRYTAAGDTNSLAEFKKKLPDLYSQELAPVKTSAEKFLTASIQIGASNANQRTQNNINMVYFLMALLVGILIICEVGVYIFARANKKAIEEIEHKTRQVTEASNKLSRSREKMEEAVQTNFLTGFKNRYSLEKDMGERLASEQFNIAAFDIDNFKSINDMYGYDFGDEYLLQIAERLKTECGQSAEIYNITGNEFVFIFHREVSDSQAIRLVENAVAVMNAPYTIFNLTVQLTVSAAHYHYMAGDCLNVNSLLVKLDNVIRTAKRNGGGQILPVADL